MACKRIAWAVKLLMSDTLHLSPNKTKVLCLGYLPPPLPMHIHTHTYTPTTHKVKVEENQELLPNGETTPEVVHVSITVGNCTCLFAHRLVQVGVLS